MTRLAEPGGKCQWVFSFFSPSSGTDKRRQLNDSPAGKNKSDCCFFFCYDRLISVSCSYSIWILFLFDIKNYVLTLKLF